MTAAPSAAKVISEEYGSAIVGVYDDIYGELDEASAEITALREWVLRAGGRGAVVELGVGTARVLGPLARSLAGEPGLRFVGIDGSAALLAQAAERYPDVPFDLHESDFSGAGLDAIVPPGSAALVFCVCASFSMLPDPTAQVAALRNIAAMLAPDGVAVIETHSPAFVLEVIGSAPTSMFIPYARHETGLACFSSVEDGIWRMRQTWMDGDRTTSVLERSVLTAPSDLQALAAAAGLSVTGLTGGLAGGEFVSPSSPLYAVTLRRDAAAGAS
ncbi:class I SAM-dependent methyltransferase [Microbacterium sp. IEGM 1404]|uniref:class I SAM-dependent methyltransferase n=1 Tax=Microbacterium sp. IEGM 1404 TaxID=3047084 RepID=UPI0024B6409C|nr:class I SAM-dependent methyltransferase [Microbacterium sp. IEGM 1404]MDI9892373.1 class I SAM-dependent methyltransferase [Microbacterium sp. IEGM 1404]